MYDAHMIKLADALLRIPILGLSMHFNRAFSLSPCPQIELHVLRGNFGFSEWFDGCMNVDVIK
eukprot:2278611-Pleurochrysis_carterae.AAC.1